jgi:glycosyltransferase involved in cell wall biosynthesis
MPKRRRILLAVTADVSIGFVSGIAQHLQARGWDVHVASAAGRRLASLGAVPGITVHPVAMTRHPSPLSDAVALVAAVQLLRRIRPDVVSSATPKAGLLFTLAGVVARTPVRVYQMWGLRYETASGPVRRVLVALERLTSHAATHVLAVSESLRGAATRDGIAQSSKVRVLGAGSSHGVDVDRFTVEGTVRVERQVERWPRDHSLPVVGFIGRLHPDKGIDTLAAAARLLNARGVTARLVLVGGDDGADDRVLEELSGCGWPVELWGHVDDITEALTLMDLLCLPSRREGFPNVVLEAAVAGLPTVGTPATGVIDAVVHEQTGLLSASHQAADLADQLVRLVADPGLRTLLGGAARERATAHFDQRQVWAMYAEFYEEELERT